MRKEADDTGPLAELEHWRQLMARFNALLEQIKSHECRIVINILNVARSKVLRVRILRITYLTLIFINMKLIISDCIGYHLFLEWYVKIVGNDIGLSDFKICL